MHPALKVAAAFAVFAALHSLTVSGFFKGAAERVLGRERMKAYYRLGFTLFSSAITTLAAVYIVMQPDRFLYRPPDYVLWPMHILQFAGVWLMFAAFRPFSAREFSGFGQAARYITTGETSGDIEGIEHVPLVTDGVYGLVRHPMYAGGIMMFLFEPNITENCLVLRLLVTLYFLWGGLIEERRFMSDFGDGYARYRERVPMFNVLGGIIARIRR